MSLFFAFAFAILFSFLGVLPPGIVNMNVANYSIKKSIKRARLFINGATLVVFIQSVLAFYFATFLKTHPQVMQNLKLVGCIIFIFLTIFFLIKGIQNHIVSKEIKKTPTKSKFKPFFHGVFISGLNIFPIPYYAFVSLYLSTFIKDFFNNFIGLAFVFGTTLGSFIVFIGYAYLFRKIKHKVAFFTKNINFILAIITGLITVFTIYNIN